MLTSDDSRRIWEEEKIRYEARKEFITNDVTNTAIVMGVAYLGIKGLETLASKIRHAANERRRLARLRKWINSTENPQPPTVALLMERAKIGKHGAKAQRMISDGVLDGFDGLLD